MNEYQRFRPPPSGLKDDRESTSAEWPQPDWDFFNFLKSSWNAQGSPVEKEPRGRLTWASNAWGIVCCNGQCAFYSFLVDILTNVFDTLGAVDIPRWRSCRRWSGEPRRCTGIGQLRAPDNGMCKWNISKLSNCKLCLIKRTTQGTCDTFTPLISTNLTWIKATVRIAQIMSCSGSLHSYSNKLQGYHHLSSRTFPF